MTVEFQPTRCAICDTADNAVELYPASFRPGDLTPAVFSARRAPDRLHYRLVRCLGCGLVRSDPVAPARLIDQLYRASQFNYSSETDDLRHTYGRLLDRLKPRQRGSLLEIGCGNGFFLEEARALGFREVAGVEPSEAAVKASATGIRPAIVCDVFRPGLFAPDRFDVICLFQVLDHFPDPAGVLRECLRLLAPGGKLLAVNHNVEAVSARVLRRLSPIFDIEHTFLYSPRTMRRLFEKCGFRVSTVSSVVNRFTLAYLTRLAPLPPALKKPLQGILQASRLARARLSLPLGNLALVAEKPGDGSETSRQPRDPQQQESIDS